MNVSRTLLLSFCLLVAVALPASAATVELTDEGFQPGEVELAVGEPLQLVNATDSTVSIADTEGRWDSGELEPGASFSITFNEPGTHTFTSNAFEGTATVREQATEPTEEPTEPTEEATEPTEEATEPTEEATEPIEEATAAPDELADTGVPLLSLLLGALALASLGGLALRRR